jgi:undecaprenyl-diphosphatase
VIEGLHHIDRSLFLLLNSWHAEWLNQLMNFISGPILWYPIVIGLTYLCFIRYGKKSTAVFLFFVFLTIFASDTTSSQIIKNIFMRLRPCREEDLIPLIHRFGQKCGGRFGFISSHAANTFSATFFMARSLKLERRFFILAMVFPVMVSYSRIYLGVHYPGDVLGGCLVGLMWGYFFSNSFEQYQGASRDNTH